MRVRSIVTTLLELMGFAVVVVAAFLVALPLGLVVLGAVMVLIGYLERPRS